jgi:aspartate ammonia-lyase
MTSTYRIEIDMLGEVNVPTEALYGAHTARALVNFGSRRPRLGDRPDLVRALADVKAAAAIANAELGQLELSVAEAIVRAADEVAAGDHLEEFPVALVHGGGGTSANMAMNEVIANRAGQLLGAGPGSYELVHPLDHVNRSQSTNDVVPTALAVVTLTVATRAIFQLAETSRLLKALAGRFGDTPRLGRTCLQDALPVPIGAYHAAQAAALDRAAKALEHSIRPLNEVPLGGTAVGTGFGAPAGYRERAIAVLGFRTKLYLDATGDPFDALAHLDPLFRVASEAATAAIALAKIASDIRLLSSGPVGGIGEVSIPVVQAGSSMMPGKVNPVIPELALQASFEIRGAAHIVELAASAGELDLNVMEMVVARHLPDALTELAEVAYLFRERCLTGLTWDRDAVERHLAGSLAGAVERALEDGYDRHL